jgi:hypothetical protein
VTAPPEPADCDPTWNDQLPPPTTHLHARYTPDGRAIETVTITSQEYL